MRRYWYRRTYLTIITASPFASLTRSLKTFEGSMTTKAPAACALALLAQLSHVVITHSVEWTTAAEARTAMEVRVTKTATPFLQ